MVPVGLERGKQLTVRRKVGHIVMVGDENGGARPTCEADNNIPGRFGCQARLLTALVCSWLRIASGL